MRQPAGHRNGGIPYLLRHGAVLVLLLAPLALPAHAALPAEYLPPGHPAWADLERLWNRGALPGLPVFTRPLPRVDVAAALRTALEAGPETAALPAARRLAREFAYELQSLGAPSAFRETPPPFEWSGDGAIIRARLEGSTRSTFTGDEGEVVPGTNLSWVGRAYLSDRAFALVDVGVEKIVEATPPGDSIVKGSDWFLSSTSAYLSIDTEAVELAAGLFRHRWGPGTAGTLLLSDAALSYPGFFFARTFGKRMRFLALTSALQQPEGRWVSAHRLELVVSDGLHIGLHESAAYRSTGLDFLYAVGLVPYTLVQRIHDRTVTQGQPLLPQRNNVMTGIDFAWRVGGGVRLDGELLVDDLATETSRQPNRLAYQGGASWAGRLLGGSADARVEFFKVYRYVYAVFYGADHIHDGVPLGLEDGPDSERVSAFLERDLGLDARIGLGLDATRRGEGRTGEFWDPQDPRATTDGATLSGTVETRLFPHARVECFARDVLHLRARLGALRVENAGHVSGRDETRIHGEVEASLQW